MCGIAGVLTRAGAKPPEAVLARMADAIAHRGPDGGGVKAFSGAGLAHRRLAVIDLTDAASQPLGLPDGTAWIAFNGEIYNFRSLRDELSARGWRFRSSGDTEVALAAYREFGESFVEKLDGMFALAIWDDRDGKLLLARDRTGKKPLYVYRDAERIVFGSEIKAILAHPDVDATLEDAAIPLYLAWGYVPTPRTHFSRITKLPPATCVVVDRTLRETSREYWRYPVAREPLRDDVATASAKLRDLFRAAVERRMVADVPLGAFLSGGIDSTLVVGVMSRLASRPVRTFAIGFADEPRYDETEFARLVATRFSTEHTEFKVDSRHYDLLEKIAWHFDEPFGDSSAIPTYVVSKLTREHVTVALTGDGGDELFSGYPRFRKTALMERIPRALALAAAGAARALPTRPWKSPLAKLGRTMARTGADAVGRMRSWAGFFSEDELAAVLSPELARASVDDSYRDALAEADGADAINRLLHVNARTYLLDDLNPKVDRASMAVGLETRAPFLDTALIEYVFRLPGAMKQHGKTTKWILKEAFADVLPREIVVRSKKGFSVPLGGWFRGPLAGWLQERLLAPGARIYPMLDRRFVETMAKEHASGARDWGQHFWVLAMLEVFLEARAAALPAARASAG